MQKEGEGVKGMSLSSPTARLSHITQRQGVKTYSRTSRDREGEGFGTQLSCLFLHFIGSRRYIEPNRGKEMRYLC